MNTPETLKEEYKQLQKRLNEVSSQTGSVLEELIRSIEAVRGMSFLKQWYEEQRGGLERALQAANLDSGLAQQLPVNPFESGDSQRLQEDATSNLGAAVSSLNEMVVALETWVDGFGAEGNNPNRKAEEIQERVLRAQADVIQSVQTSKKELLDEEPGPSIPPADERRDSGPRIAMEVPVSLESDTRFFYGSSENASTTGVFVATPFTMPQGTVVTLNLLFPGDEVIKSEGTVAWVRDESDHSPSGMGVSLAEGNSYLEKRLQSILQTLQEN